MSHVLIVEDDVELAQQLVDLLAGEGYRAVLAENGRIALDLLRFEPHPCLILLDLLLPELDGFAFLKTQRADRTLAAIPVCVMSALESAIPGPPAVVDALRKPVNPERLMLVVRRYCARP